MDVKKSPALRHLWFDSAKKGRLAHVVELADAGFELDARNEFQQTAAHLAATCRDPGILETLIDRGAQVDPRDDGAWTPLMMAASHGHVECLRTLIKAGADIEACDDTNMTAAMRAVEAGNAEALRALCAAGAKIDGRGGPERKSLFDMARPNCLPILRSELDLREARAKALAEATEIESQTAPAAPAIRARPAI